MNTLTKPLRSPRPTDPYIRDKDGNWQFNGHPGQRRALVSRARFILVLAGWQSGKTLIGPRWMLEEIARRGPGDYLVAAPTYALMELKVVPEYRSLFVTRLHLGKMRESPRPLFMLSAHGRAFMRMANPVAWPDDDNTETLIRFGHAADPDSLESATFKAAHLDEAGQKKFKRASWDAIQGRLSIFMGRILITTRPYYFGWLKYEVYDRWKAGDKDYDVINFKSIDNPVFPPEEYERQRQRLPSWKFRLMYEGVFERPAGMIYDCFSEKHHIPRFNIPESWPRHLGMDFGGVHTAGVFLAEEHTRKDSGEMGEKTGRYIVYRTYEAGKKPKRLHVSALLAGEPRLPHAVGGSWSEDEWRIDFADVGLPMSRAPIKGVEAGIERVYDLMGGVNPETQEESLIRLIIFDDLLGLIDGIESYSRKLDASDLPTEGIENKETFHLNDALRYIVSDIVKSKPDFNWGYASG